VKEKGGKRSGGKGRGKDSLKIEGKIITY